MPNASKLVKMGQAQHMGKWEAHTAMIRLVTQLRERLDEVGALTGADETAIDDVVYTFLSQLPSKVADEVRQG